MFISVDNTPLDFRKEQTIGSRFNDNYYQFRICTGYDHNMIIDGEDSELKNVGFCKSDKTGICLEVYTTEPAIQLYSGNFIHFDPVLNGKKRNSLSKKWWFLYGGTTFSRFNGSF